MKIQINSLEALERLIGGDTEVEIDIRNSVVQEFTKKHLKAIATNDLVSKAHLATIDHIDTTFFGIVKKDRFNQKYRFKEEYTKELFEELEYNLKNSLWEEVKKVTEIHRTREIVEGYLKDAQERIVDQLTDKVLENKLNSMVEARLKEKLGLK